MQNNFLARFAEKLTPKAKNMLLLTGIIAMLLATPLMAFAKARPGKQSTIAGTATFLGISQHFYNESLYPRDTNIQDLVIGDTLEVMLGTQIVPGIYLGSNTVYANKQIMNLKASTNLQQAPILDLQPLSMSFIGSRDCPQGTVQNVVVFVCQARISSRQNAQAEISPA